MFKKIYIIEDEPNACDSLFLRMLNYYSRAKRSVEIIFIILLKPDKINIFKDSMAKMERIYNEQLQSFKNAGIDIAAYFKFDIKKCRCVVLPNQIYENNKYSDIVKEVMCIIDQDHSSAMVDVILLTDSDEDIKRLASNKMILSHYLYSEDFIKQHGVIYTNYVNPDVSINWKTVLKNNGNHARIMVYPRYDIDGSTSIPVDFFEMLYIK